MWGGQCKVTVLLLRKAQGEHRHGIRSVYVSSGTVTRNTTSGPLLGTQLHVEFIHAAKTNQIQSLEADTL